MYNVCILMYTFLSTYSLFIYVHVYLCAGICRHVYVRACGSLYAYTHTMYACMCVHAIYACVYVYVCICA